MTQIQPLSKIFEPIQIGSMRLRNRIMLPPHASAVGKLFGTPEEADRHIGYWVARARAGAAWIGGITGFIENLFPPGFDPSGVGARSKGIFRRPDFVDRVGLYAEALHAAGAAATTQLVIQGGMPHAPSQTLSGPVINAVPHALTRREIRWFVDEYRFSALQAQRAGLEGVELHANHDDLIEWFLSPKTNMRDDEYGGSFEGRGRFLAEILSEIRQAAGADFVIGVRMNMMEGEPGGWDQQGGLALARYLQDLGSVDYLHLVMGSPWGNPSYIQPHYYKPAQWATMAGNIRRHLTLPIVYTGKVTSPDVAEAVIASGMADVVGMARAHFADPDLVAKAAGDRSRIRPCIGCNECIGRTYMEQIPFACTVNPAVGSEYQGPLPRAASAKRLLVIGGGPAGMELAATARERGHDVALWERDTALGGQMRLSSAFPTQEIFLDYIDHQQQRLEDAGVEVRLGTQATEGDILNHGADVVAIATGARARRPAIPGVDGSNVKDIWQIAKGETFDGQRIAVIAQDDHIPPLALADHLASLGHDVTLFYPTNGPAPLVTRYTMGAILARLSEANVDIVCMVEAVEIDLPRLVTRHVYSGRATIHDGFAGVALACGGTSEDALYRGLEGKIANLHVLGDAFAPRRTVFATRQGWQLANAL